MSEDQNDFEDIPGDVPSQQEEAAPDARPEPSAVHEGVKQALAQQTGKQIDLAPCPCGVPNVNLMIDLPQGAKVGRAGCSACGVWGVDFLAPRTQNQELIGGHAAKAWNEAPRG